MKNTTAVNISSVSTEKIIDLSYIWFDKNWYPLPPWNNFAKEMGSGKNTFLIERAFSLETI